MSDGTNSNTFVLKLTNVFFLMILIVEFTPLMLLHLEFYALLGIAQTKLPLGKMNVNKYITCGDPNIELRLVSIYEYIY